MVSKKSLKKRNNVNKRKGNSKKNNITNNNSIKICYTGDGANKSQHSKNEFITLMKSKFKGECSRFVRGKKCKSCKQLKKNWNNYFKKSTKQNNAEFDKKQDRLTKKCESCKKKKIKLCSFEDFIEYSGANIGKCE
jgi:hypothetical protein